MEEEAVEEEEVEKGEVEEGNSFFIKSCKTRNNPE